MTLYAHIAEERCERDISTQCLTRHKNKPELQKQHRQQRTLRSDKGGKHHFPILINSRASHDKLDLIQLSHISLIFAEILILCDNQVQTVLFVWRSSSKPLKKNAVHNVRQCLGRASERESKQAEVNAAEQKEKSEPHLVSGSYNKETNEQTKKQKKPTASQVETKAELLRVSLFTSFSAPSLRL